MRLKEGALGQLTGYPSYVELLRKYMAYVKECEGVDFVECGYQGYPGDTAFSAEEWSLLVALSNRNNSEA